MTMFHGLGMFILGMFAIIVGGIIAWYIITIVFNYMMMFNIIVHFTFIYFIIFII